MKGTSCRKVYSGRMEQYLCMDILDNELILSVELLVDSGKPWLFQQDNAPCHKSKKVMAYFNESDIRVMPWPVRSPDLNPIEHLWNIIDKKLVSQRLNNLYELELAIVQVWSEIDSSTCANLIESMLKRIGLCLKQKVVILNIKFIKM
jgi:hypothetical protein